MQVQRSQFNFDINSYRELRTLSAIKIQKTFKMYLARKQYLEVYAVTSVIICKWKAALLSRELQHQYSELKDSANFTKSLEKATIY